MERGEAWVSPSGFPPVRTPLWPGTAGLRSKWILAGAWNADCALGPGHYDARPMALADDAEYYLLVGEETRGPFSLGQLHEQWHAGHLPLDTLFLRKGLPDARPINCIVEQIIAFRPAPPAPAAPAAAATAAVGASPTVPDRGETARPAAAPNYPLRLGLGLVAIAALAWLVNPGRPKPPAQQVLHARIEVTLVELRVENLNLFDWTNVVVRLEANAPEALQARLARVPAGETVKLPLTKFSDGKGKHFEPWKSMVTEVWIGGDTYEFRQFPFPPK